MQNVLRVLLTSAIIFSSCSQVRNIKNSPSEESFYSKINKATDGKSVSIITTNGDIYEGTNVIVASDSTQWVQESSSETVIYPTDQIHKIRIKDRFKGAVGGLLFGIPAGLGALFIASKLDLDLPEGSSQVDYLLSALLIGSLVGAGIGVAIGDKSDYIINPLKE